MATIKVRQNGPYLVEEGAEGGEVTIVDWNGRRYVVDRRPVALCRCGASARKPFCDGTHRTIDFQASEGADGEPTT